MSKLCLRCGKPGEFHKGKSRHCKVCRSEKYRMAREKRKRTLSVMLTLQCVDCGIQHIDLGFFDFHHVDPSNKEFTIGANYTSIAWKRLIKEVNKCVLLCPNCHRLRHMEER